MNNAIAAALYQRFNLVDQVVLIWGGSGQIGTVLQHELRTFGADVIVTRSSQDGVAQSLADRPDLPGKMLGAVACDLTDLTQVDRAAREIESILNGRAVDITVVNGGGVVRGVKPVERFADFPVEDFERAARLNYFGPMRALQQSIPFMTGARNPRIGATVSMSYKGRLSRVFPYRGAKLALEDLLSFLTVDTMKITKNFTVLGWRPGFVLADQNRAVLDEIRRNAIIEHMPRGEWQTAEEVAQVMAATLTGVFKACHGSIIDVAAGFSHAGLGMSAI